MKILDMIIEELNEQEKEAGGDGQWDRLHSKPVEIVETPHGTVHRDIESGKFTKKD